MTGKRCYLLRDVLQILQISRPQFYVLRERGQLPFIEELQPRIGRLMRFRADPIDRYIAGEFETRHFLRSHRRLHA